MTRGRISAVTGGRSTSRGDGDPGGGAPARRPLPGSPTISAATGEGAARRDPRRLWQVPERRAAVEAALAPVRVPPAEERTAQARRIAATRVNFFTMARGED